MADELETELNQPSESQKRITQLSEKVRLTSEERDEMKRLSDEKDNKLSEKDKKIEFLNSFSDVASKYSGASEFKNDIEEKVMKGYSVEDATISVLNAKGKFTPTQTTESEQVAGGSASTALPQRSITKPLSQMSRDEKREALLDLESKGDFSLT